MKTTMSYKYHVKEYMNLTEFEKDLNRSDKWKLHDWKMTGEYVIIAIFSEPYLERN